MSRMSRGIGMVIVGWLGLVQAVAADARLNPLEPAAWVIESAVYTGEIRDRVARLQARYTMQVIRDGWVEIPLVLPEATITDVRIEKKVGQAHIVPRNGSYALAASRKGTFQVRVELACLLTQDSQFEGIRLGIPQATFSTLSVLIPRKEIELRDVDQLYAAVEPVDHRDGVKLIARLGSADRVDLRWRMKPASPIKVEPVLYGEVRTLVTLEKPLARVISFIEYRVAQGEAKELRIRLPDGVSILNVRGAGIEDWRVTDAPKDKTLLVTLNFLLKDSTYQLVIEGEQSLKEGEGEYALPELQLVGVKQERGQLAVAREGNLEIAAKMSAGVTRIDVKELPDVLRAASASPVMLAFRYHQHPYQVAVALTPHEDHAVLAAIAEQGELITVLSRQGELLTRATYLIKANKKQFLEALLPQGAQLWSCLVDGKSVKPVQGADEKLLVPLDAIGETADEVLVELVYFERRPELTRIGRLKLQGPMLDIPTTIANWSLYTPRQVKLLRTSGNLERGVSMVAFVDEPMSPMSVASAVDRVVVSPESQSMLENEDVASAVRYRLAEQLKRKDPAGRLWRGKQSKEPVQQQSIPHVALGNSEFGQGHEEKSGDRARINGMVEEVALRMQETGILPLKIRLPKAGQVHRFHRLMTAQEALELEVLFVNLPAAALPWVGFGLLLLSGLPFLWRMWT